MSLFKIKINKKFKFIFLFFLLSVVFLPFKNISAATLTTENLLANSVILKATGLTPGQTARLWVSGIPPTPNYLVSHDFIVNNDGWAFSSFSGLVSNKTYKGGLTLSGGVANTIDFSTPKSSNKLITSFTIVSGLINSTGVINYNLGTIELTVPNGSDVTALAPTIILPAGATVSPASSVSQNFTNPVDYTVTAEDGSTWSYRATITIAPPPGPKNTDTTYTFLEPLPGIDETIDTKASDSNQCPFGKYFNMMVKLFFGVAGVLAVVMIVWGGVQYMTSDLVSSKEAGKESIRNAIFGLLLALGAYIILNTINPDLLKVCLSNIKPTELLISPEQESIINNTTGGGNCSVVTDTNNKCHPNNMQTYFTGTTSKPEPFDTMANQASAICFLESHGVANAPGNASPENILDKCADNKPFSFGLFQINASAHRNNIKDASGNLICKNAFVIPPGHDSSQGNPIEDVIARDGNRYHSKWSCTTHEPEYTACKNFLINPQNNIKYAATSTSLNRWSSWSTNNSCHF